MTYLRFSPIGPNIWKVKRRVGARSAAIAEVVLHHRDGVCHMVPVAGYAYNKEELESITAFMWVAANENTAVKAS